MEVKVIKDYLMIIPETEFEAQWLRSFDIGNVFHKCGVSSKDYLGLKIERKTDLLSKEKD